MSIYTFKQQQIIILSLIILLGVFLAYSLKDIFTAVLGCIILYTLTRGLYLSLINKYNWKPVFAALLLIIGTFIIIVLPFFTLSWMVINKISYYSSNPQEIQLIIDHLSTISGMDIEHSETVSKVIQNIESWLLGAFPSVVSALLNIALLISVMYFLLYFMYTEHARFERTLMHYMPFREENSLLLATELRNIIFSNVLGQGLIAAVQGAFVGIGFVIFGIKDPVFWGVASALLSFVPVVGSALVFVPTGLISMSYGNYTAGIGIIAWGALVVANIDNIIRLIINKRVANTHPIITIIGVIIGLPMFGILGLVFGPLLLSYFLLLISIYEKRIDLVEHRPPKKTIIIPDDKHAG